LPTDLPDLFDMRRNDSTHVDKQYGLGIRSDLALQILGTHLKRLPLTIDKNHLCPGMYGRGGASDERMAWNDNRRPFDADGPNDELDGTGAVACPKSFFSPAILPPSALKLLNFGPHIDDPATKDLLKASHD